MFRNAGLHRKTEKGEGTHFFQSLDTPMLPPVCWQLLCHPGDTCPLGGGRSLQQHLNPVGWFPYTSRTSDTQDSQPQLASHWIPGPEGPSSELSQNSALSSGPFQFCREPLLQNKFLSFN